jgi:hypothetical protein
MGEVALEMVFLRYFSVPPASRHFYISLCMRITTLCMHDGRDQAARYHIPNLEVWGFTSESTVLTFW